MRRTAGAAMPPNIPAARRMFLICSGKCAIIKANEKPRMKQRPRVYPRTNWARDKTCNRGHQLNDKTVCLDHRGYFYCRMCKSEGDRLHWNERKVRRKAKL